MKKELLRNLGLDIFVENNNLDILFCFSSNEKSSEGKAFEIWKGQDRPKTPNPIVKTEK